MNSSQKIIDFSEDKSFDELVIIDSKNSPILVNFFASWYSPCMRLKPKLEEISTTNNIKLINIEVDENQELSTRYNVSEIPHVFLFHNGYSIMDFCGTDKNKKLNQMVEYITQKKHYKALYWIDYNKQPELVADNKLGNFDNSLIEPVSIKYKNKSKGRTRILRR